MEALEEFHKKMPDPVKRERSWENITKGVDSRYFIDAVKRFDKLLSDMETSLSMAPWLAGQQLSLADIAYAPYATRLDHLQLEFLWDKRINLARWYERLRQRPTYKEALEEWFNPNYLPLMKEKGIEVRERVKRIVASA